MLVGESVLPGEGDMREKMVWREREPTRARP